MDNIIEGILLIENEAVEAMRDTEAIKANLAKSIADETKRIFDETEKQTEDLLKSYAVESHNETLNSIGELKAKSAAKIEEMKKEYEDNHEKWENEIFAKIVGD